MLVKRISGRYSALTVTTYAMLIGALVLLPAALAEGLAAAVVDLDGQTLMLVLFLGVLGGAVLWYLYGFALSTLNPTQAAVYVNLNPLAAMILATVLLGERVTGPMLLGFAMVLAGVVLMNWPKRAEGNSTLASGWTRRCPWREGIGQDLDLIKAGLRIEDVLGGTPGSRLQPDFAQLLDIETAPLPTGRQSGAATTGVLIDQDMSDTPLGAQSVRTEDALLVVVTSNDLLLAADGVGQDRVGVHRFAPVTCTASWPSRLSTGKIRASRGKGGAACGGQIQRRSANHGRMYA